MTTANDRAFRIDDAPMEFDRTSGWRFVRDAGDVIQGADGSWLLTSYEAVRFAHRHPEIFSSARAFDVLASPVPLIPIAVDQPDHKRYRRVLDPMLAPRVINQMEDTLRHQVRVLVEAFADRGHCDAIEELARLYPTQVFLTLFGMPLEDRDRFIGWVDTINEKVDRDPTATPPPELVEASMALFGYLQDYIDQKRADPGDDMLSSVLALDGEEAWSNEEILGMSFLFVLAGLDTVTATIGFILLHLAQHPGLRRGLVADPSLVTPTIEEILRLELPAPAPPRVTTEDVKVCGTLIPAGSNVSLCLATANRDAAQFEVPDDVHLDQADQGHLSFGGGIHRCLGSHLARRELRLVVEEWHELIPEYEVAPGAEPSVVWPAGTLHLSSLPLVFPPANHGRP